MNHVLNMLNNEHLDDIKANGVEIIDPFQTCDLLFINDLFGKHSKANININNILYLFCIHVHQHKAQEC